MYNQILKLVDNNPQIIKLGLERTYKLFNMCNNPQNSLSIVQIVGTNGKGSVSAMLANVFYKNNIKIGLYTSPHLNSFKERIQINFKSIEDSEIEIFINKYKEHIKESKVTFFELMTVMALWYFKKNNVDIAILETGLGGRLDSVTAAHASALIITSISRDHQKILGPTLLDIAGEKAGAILSTTKIIFSTNQNQKIKSILNNRAEHFNKKISYVAKDYLKNDNFLYLQGQHQHQNGNLAYHSVIKIADLFQLKINYNNITEHILSAFWPGRMQTIQKFPTIIFDVCHNEAGIHACLEFCKIKFKSYNKKYMVAAFEDNKKIFNSFSKLANLFDEIIITETNIRKSMDAKILAKQLNKKNIFIETNIDKALDKTIHSLINNDILIILGSHYIGPYINKIFKNCFAIHNKEVITSQTRAT